ncbi:MFS transporter [Natrarchaeobius oligotrophus]|uniref:MFS transporter n=1 Tax=Natrarchaeobius chitinivorans TaxID=1679083 RepID=A0A3N6MM46_NATCH|nr:MFS transporter [Natrarchaeobius chitinivorans]RQH02605.1 MFS transporter [Natrarchaeobius chitinivorans]
MSETQTPTKATLWVIVASATLTIMAGAILGPVVPQIQSGLGVSESLAGLIITTHAAFIVLTSPIAGALVDRFGPRRPYVFGLFLYAVGGSAGLFIDAFVPLLLSRAVLGVGVAFVYTGITVLIFDLYEGQRMDRALGLRSGANSFGGATWPVVGGLLGTISWQLPFGVYLVAIPLALLAIATVPPTGRGSAAHGRSAGEAKRTDSARSLDGSASVVSIVRRRPALPFVYLLYFGANALLFAIVVFYPQLLATIGVTSSSYIGLYLAANGIAGGVSGVLYDRLNRRFGRHLLVLVAFAFWTAAFALATRAGSPLSALPPVVLFGLGLGLVFPSSFAWIESLAPTSRQGQFGSYLATFGYVGQFLSPIVFGPIVTAFGVRGVFGAATLAAALGVGAITLALARRNSVEYRLRKVR